MHVFQEHSASAGWRTRRPGGAGCQTAGAARQANYRRQLSPAQAEEQRKRDRIRHTCRRILNGDIVRPSSISEAVEFLILSPGSQMWVSGDQ